LGKALAAQFKHTAKKEKRKGKKVKQRKREKWKSVATKLRFIRGSQELSLFFFSLFHFSPFSL
jgi:hypothetical protein